MTGHHPWEGVVLVGEGGAAAAEEEEVSLHGKHQRESQVLLAPEAGW